MKKYKNLGNTPSEQNPMCKCGHIRAYHINPKTGIDDGCIFWYNCECEKFDPAENYKINSDGQLVERP